MSKKSRRKKQKHSPSRRFPWLWVAIGGALLLIIGGAMLMLLGRPSTDVVEVDSNFSPEVSGAPRLAIDQTLIDEGDVKVNTMIQTSFRLQNVGDQPLRILGEPAVELVEGC